MVWNFGFKLNEICSLSLLLAEEVVLNKTETNYEFGEATYIC